MRERGVLKLYYREERERYIELLVLEEGCFLEILKTSISINSVIFFSLLFLLICLSHESYSSTVLRYNIQYSCLDK